MMAINLHPDGPEWDCIFCMAVGSDENEDVHNMSSMARFIGVGKPNRISVAKAKEFMRTVAAFCTRHNIDDELFKAEVFKLLADVASQTEWEVKQIGERDRRLNDAIDSWAKQQSVADHP